MSNLSILFAIALFACPITSSSWAQERAAFPGPNSEHPPYPDTTLIKFQWNYSCPTHKGCSFSCPGGGGADHVTKLDVYLGGIFDATDGLALFYSFATEYVSSGTGFLVIDVWESPEAFARFGEVLGPVLGQVGLQPTPDVRQIHRIIAREVASTTR